MTLLRLYYFTEIIKWGSISKAAEHLNISHVALSRTLKKLEDEVGYPLVVHHKRLIKITEYGRIFLNFCYSIIHEMEDIQYEFQEMQGIFEKNQIHLGVTDGNYYGDWLMDLYEDYPNMKIHVLQMSYGEIQQNLINGNLDFGISSTSNSHPSLSEQLLISQPYELLVLSENPLAQRKYIDLDILAKEPIISLPPSHKERMIDNISREMYFKPNIIFEGNQDIMIEMFHAGVGSILTCAHNKQQWLQLSSSHYKSLAIRGTFTRYEIYLLWSTHRYVGKYASLFKNHVFDYYHVQ